MAKRKSRITKFPTLKQLGTKPLLLGFVSLMFCCTLAFGISPFSAQQNQTPELPQKQVAPESSARTQKENSPSTVVNPGTVSTEQQREPGSYPDIKIHFINVGQGDSEFIELPDGKTMLIDAGEADQGPVVARYISKLGHTKIDYLVATHPHADHIGGLAYVISNFDIGEVWAPKVVHTTKTYERFLDAVFEKGLQIHTAQAGAQIGEAQATGEHDEAVNQAYSLSMLAPQASLSADNLNNYSIVLKLSYGTMSALLTGDAPSETIAAAGHADLLKVGHHGSKTSTNTAVMQAVSPLFAVISYGADNNYGHPTRQALDALRLNNVTIYGTAVNGNIVAHMSTTHISMQPQSEGEVVSAQEIKNQQDAQAPPTSTEIDASAKTGADTNTLSSTTSDADTSNQSERRVYATAKGKRWHASSSCRTLKKSKTVSEISLSAAENRGLTPCKICAQ